jgi:hypothetical protein
VVSWNLQICAHDVPIHGLNATAPWQESALSKLGAWLESRSTPYRKAIKNSDN